MSTENPTRPSGDRLAEEYRASRLRTTAILDGISADDEQRIVPTCPDWRVRDLLSHVNGLADDLSAGRNPAGDTQAWVDQQVADRAETTVAEQLEQWSTSGEAFEGTLRKVPQLGLLVIDLISHEHDIAGALGVQSDRSSSGIEMVMSSKTSTVEKDLVAAGLNAIRVVGGDNSWEYGQGDVELEVRGDLWEMFRLTGGRRSMAQLLACDHDGDIERYAPGLVHNPLPITDIIE
ncbi:maleylpyruvate isomerase family mycothiol-dependent enzyme [Ilumatobacter nonamiensis]|uniref:maleylpyruvate isomerase family mycothiol-dependent enzyme n=1 Tax=Ilumatobacter nonamiensis TaxID=467093 RepID=UPI00034A7460|nr:maleylpyruvate isomerase family mycothiol-dependent enzyme [Ilumatobacter nonamiensis]